MPAATYPFMVTHVHWRGDPTREEHSALHLLEEFTDLDEAKLQGSYMVDALIVLIRAAFADISTYPITAQATDCSGNRRPYDCDELVEFLSEGWGIPDLPGACFKVLEPAEVTRYAEILRRQLLQPDLFEDERAAIRSTVSWLASIFDGRVLLISRLEG